MTLESNSDDILFQRIVILSKPASSEANSISVTTLDVPEAFPFFILVKVDLTLFFSLWLRSNYWIF